MSRPTFPAHTHLDATSQVSFDMWKAGEMGRVGNASEAIESGAEPMNIYKPMPPIRCVVEPPCGHCWYCEQRVNK